MSMRSEGPTTSLSTPPGKSAHGGHAPRGISSGVGGIRSIASPLSRLGDGWGTGRWFVLALAAIVAGMVVMDRQWLFATPVYEWGDNAANSLQIYRATHLLEYLGNYSRFGFHHPGPAFFYVYAAGEVVFYNILHLVPAPENAHLLAGVLLQSTFLAAAIAVASSYAAPRRGLFVAASIAIAFVYFQISGNLDFSVWPPDQLVVPFACFVVVAVAVGLGRLGLLPLLVICGGFLVHGHVAQPLYVVPMSALAIGLGVRRSSKDLAITVGGVIRTHIKPLSAAAAIAAIFVAPLLVDAVQPGSNLGKILASLTQPRAPSDVRSPIELIDYALSFLGYPLDVYRFDSSVHFGSFLSGHWTGFALSFVALFALPAGLLALHRMDRRRNQRSDRSTPDESGGASSPASPAGPTVTRFYLTYAGFLAIAAALTLVWVALQKGGLYAFNSYFLYGLMFAAFLPTLVSISRRWPVRGLRLATGLAGLFAIVVAASSAIPLPDSEFTEGSVLHDSVAVLLASRNGHDPVLLEFATDADWNQGAAVALDLLRSNVPWYVDAKWGLQFGSDHVYHPGSDARPEIWILTAPDAAHPGQVVLSPRIAIYPRPPSLANSGRSP